MHCDICGRENAYIHKLDRTYGKGKHTITIYFPCDMFDL